MSRRVGSRREKPYTPNCAQAAETDVRLQFKGCGSSFQVGRGQISDRWSLIPLRVHLSLLVQIVIGDSDDPRFAVKRIEAEKWCDAGLHLNACAANSLISRR